MTLSNYHHYSMLIKNYKLILIIILAVFIRGLLVWQYPSLNSDEAAIGYNSYSLLLTGKDEHGQSYPIHFKSFGDYKPGGYFYLVMPFIKIFGLEALSVRLPNIILSTVAIFFIYKIVKILLNNHVLALISAAVLTISPWHIHFSRGGWESSAALSMIIIGTYYFLRFVNSLKITDYFIFVILFSLCLYTYHSARIFAPLFAISLIIIHHKTFFSIYKKTILPTLFGILICIPLAISFFSNGGSTRFSGVGITADIGPRLRSEQQLNQDTSLDLFTRIIHNYRLNYLLSWGQKYFSHFNFSFLFIRGDEVPRSKAPEMGQAYLFEFPLLIIGIIYFYNSKKIDRKTKQIFLYWTIISPLASSLTFQAPSALRSLPLVVPLTFFISCGIYSLFNKTKKFIFVLFIIAFYIFSLGYYFDSYFIHYQKRYPFAWEYGFKNIIPYVEANKDKFSHIFITDTYDQPYIYYLFYSLYSPDKIQSQIKLTTPDKYGFSTVSQIDNIHFGNIEKFEFPASSLIVAGKEKLEGSPVFQVDPTFKIFVK